MTTNETANASVHRIARRLSGDFHLGVDRDAVIDDLGLREAC